MLNKERFEKFHKDNPKVYEMFEKFTFSAIGAGRKHYGAQGIIERLRWWTSIETVGDEYKINNDYAAFYARMFEEKNPQHKGFFRKRISIADFKPWMIDKYIKES